jgi:hypothetical protein
MPPVNLFARLVIKIPPNNPYSWIQCVPGSAQSAILDGRPFYCQLRSAFAMRK